MATPPAGIKGRGASSYSGTLWPRLPQGSRVAVRAAIPKVDAVELLRKELSRPGYRCELIALGAAQAAEKAPAEIGRQRIIPRRNKRLTP